MNTFQQQKQPMNQQYSSSDHSDFERLFDTMGSSKQLYAQISRYAVETDCIDLQQKYMDMAVQCQQQLSQMHRLMQERGMTGHQMAAPPQLQEAVQHFSNSAHQLFPEQSESYRR